MEDSRYLIYELLHRRIAVTAKQGRVRGEVRKVYRDVLENRVKVTVDGKEVEFQEPTTIRRDGDDVVFSYGRAGIEEDDRVLFAEAHQAGGESLHDVLRRTAPVQTRETRFCCLV